LAPHWEESAIFIGINKLIAKSLEEGNNNNNRLIYPCKIVNRFECPYQKGKVTDANFHVKDLFELEKMVYAVEIALATAIYYETSKFRIKNKQELYEALTDREKLMSIRTSTQYHAFNKKEKL